MDLVRDPGEMKNVAYSPEYAAQVAESRVFLKKWYVDHGLELGTAFEVKPSAQ